MEAIKLSNINLSFAAKKILKGINWTVNQGEIATLLGPNGCGKSTLLKILTGNIKEFTGEVQYGNKNIKEFTGKEMAQHMAFLPQTPELPKDMTVDELVYCGRFPYQNWWKNTAVEDRLAVEEALNATKTLHLRHRIVSSLSGGERQRVWIAMALAQQPEILVLDEPTTYLDINHQLEILELLKKLNIEKKLTVIMVLHELNQAAHYSHKLAVLHEGIIAEAGRPSQVMTKDLIKKVFNVNSDIIFEENDIPYIKIKGLL